MILFDDRGPPHLPRGGKTVIQILRRDQENQKIHWLEHLILHLCFVQQTLGDDEGFATYGRFVYSTP